MTRVALRFAVVALALAGAASPDANAQKPDFPTEFKNLKVFDKKIAPRELKKTMDGFTEQLGVKCTFCHNLDDYGSDEKEHKTDARKMVQLVQFMRANKAKYWRLPPRQVRAGPVRALKAREKTGHGVSTSWRDALMSLGSKAAFTVVVLSAAFVAAQEGKELPVRRIPNIGEAAELYFSPDSRYMIGTVKQEGETTHHTYTLRVDGTEVRRINDKGEDACSYFFPDMKRLLWTSTRDNLEMPKGNWSDTNDYPQGAELYTSKLDGSDVKRLTKNAQYDAESSMSPDGKWIVFTRQTDGKLDLWRMRTDGSDPMQVTKTEDAQEGGSFYLSDSETIIYRAWNRADQANRSRPMTIYTIKHDGTGTTQITTDPGLNWAPHPAPDGVHFAYVRMPEPGNFEVFIMNMKTKEKRQMTFNKAFDGYPAFSPDGKTLAFATSRDAKPGERRVWTYLMDISSLGIQPLKKK